MKHYQAAAVQVTSGPDVEDNLRVCRYWIQAAVQSGAELVALPENFAFIGSDQDKVTQAASIAKAGLSFLSEMAKELGIVLLGGGLPMPAQDGHVFNTALLVNSAGLEVVRYEKMHLFDVDLPGGDTHRESESVQPGTKPPPVFRDPELGNLGLSVCYDLRFPELYRHLSQQGADLLLIPAAFTAYTGRYHWEVLLRARAIENTCYVVAPAQVGSHSERRHSYGHALIVDPWGEILADAGPEPGFAIGRIDPRRLAKIRSRMPSLQHRRM